MDLSKILEGLNPAQESAVKSPFAVVQILAPPGSGKTKTLTSRVSWLLCHEGYAPWNIVCLTFTIKSAREMQSRIAKQTGNGLESKLILGTFHSVCLRYLRSYGQLIGLKKGFGIADSSDTKAIILRIIKRERLTIDPNVAKNRISKCKARNETCAQVERSSKKGVDQQEFLIIYQAYQDHLEASNLLDYDDLLMKCVQLLTLHPECVANVDAVLIDEFQDTNNVQFMLMRLFAQHKKKITTVGDPDQSIYGWRSAEIKNLERMRKLYVDIQVIHLEENYRSSATILRAAQGVIEQDSARPQKSLQATHCGGTIPVLRKLFSAEAEAQWTVAEIQRCLSLTGGSVLDFSDFAILVRSASQSRQLELAMGHAAIPYRMVGGLRFFDRFEIKVLLDYLRTIAHTGNSDAVARILNIPPRGVGKDTVKELLEEASATGKPLWDLIRDTIQGIQKCTTKVSKQSERGLATFFNIIETCRKKVEASEKTAFPYDLLEFVIKRVEFRRYLDKMYPEDTENVRWANVEELLVQASDADAANSGNGLDPDDLPKLKEVDQRIEGNVAEETLAKFLSNVALATELQTADQADSEGKPRPSVTISTMHAAKGLEWPVVFVPSAYLGSIPHSRAEDHDEERRLLYVAMTRAQVLLYLSCPARSSGGDETTLSPFLDTKEVRSCFVSQGPSIHADRVFDICDILRRDRPSHEDLIEAEKRLQVLDDDEYKWPLDGSRSQEALRPHEKRLTAVRFKSGHEGLNRYGLPNIASTKTALLRPSLSDDQGLQRSDRSGSVPVSASVFMTATSQLKIQQETDSAGKAPSVTSLPGRTAESNRTIKQVKGQHTLTGMWSSSSQASVTGADHGNCASRASSDQKTSTKVERAPTYRENASYCSQPPGAKALVSREQSYTTAGAGTQNHTSISRGPLLPSADNCPARRPLGVIPEDLKCHQIRLGPSFKRSRSDLEANGPRKRHVWTTLIPGSGEALDKADAEPASGIHASDSRGLLAKEGNVPSGVHSSPTVHRTTMAQLQEAQSAPIRRLGIRGSTSGWVSKESQPFKVPHLSRLSDTSRTY